MSLQDQLVYELPIDHISQTTNPTRNDISIQLNTSTTNTSNLELVEIRFTLPPNELAPQLYGEKNENSIEAGQEENSTVPSENDEATPAERLCRILQVCCSIECIYILLYIYIYIIYIQSYSRIRDEGSR